MIVFATAIESEPAGVIELMNPAMLIVVVSRKLSAIPDTMEI